MLALADEVDKEANAIPNVRPLQDVADELAEAIRVLSERGLAERSPRAAQALIRVLLERFDDVLEGGVIAARRRAVRSRELLQLLQLLLN